ncbi:MAG: hypothetical protein Ct9H300mP7_1960 [Verrucomicrobiota bacterium]|nr:MAG: hypothetical protein Ct9H300mP7_1960 [Verrucomicrobiota bacterium]
MPTARTAHSSPPPRNARKQPVRDRRTKGPRLLENDRLIVTRNEVASDEWSRTSKIGFKQPESTVEEIPIPGADNAHAQLIANFVNAILDGEPSSPPARAASAPSSWPT